MSVSITPGAIELIKAGWGAAACSSATARLKWSMPALAAQYTALPAMAWRPRPDEMLSTRR